MRASERACICPFVCERASRATCVLHTSESWSTAAHNSHCSTRLCRHERLLESLKNSDLSSRHLRPILKRGAERSTMHSGHPARPRLPREHPAVHILVDCSYDALMSEDERRGLCRQLDCCVRSGASSRETWRCEMCCPARSFDAAWRECAGSTTGTGSRRGSTGARQQHGPAACA